MKERCEKAWEDVSGVAVEQFPSSERLYKDSGYGERKLVVEQGIRRFICLASRLASKSWTECTSGYSLPCYSFVR